MRRLVVLAAVALAVLTSATARLFVWPSAGSPTSADAVVIFAGGRGERLARAQQLMADGLASNLVIPNGTAPEWPAGNTACHDTQRYAVFCPVPDPDTTRGEARAIAALAHARRWTRVILVTSTYQVTRADLLLGRCFDGDIQRVRADPGLSVFAWPRRIGHEMLAWTYAMTLDRGC